MDVTDEMRRDAEARGRPVVDYVELLLAKGRQAQREGGAVSSAMEKIHALRPGGMGIGIEEGGFWRVRGRVASAAVGGRWFGHAARLVGLQSLCPHL